MHVAIDVHAWLLPLKQPIGCYNNVAATLYAAAM
jgi:hypothetical protein